MGFRFWRRIKIAPGVTLNLSKSGGSLSFGWRGTRFTVGPRGKRVTLGIPGTGLFYTTTLRGTAPRGGQGSRGATAAVPAVPPENRLTLGFFQRLITPADEKAFVDGCRELAMGDENKAFQQFQQAAHLANAAYLAGFLALKRGQLEQAASYLTLAAQKYNELGSCFTKYGIAPIMSLSITDEVSAHIGPDPRGVLLALVEVYQRQQRRGDAIACLERLLQLAPNDVVVKLSLAELLMDAGAGDQNVCRRVVQLAEDIDNETPVHTALLLYKAKALRSLGFFDTALKTLTDALRRKAGRSPELLLALRYERALVYEDLGQRRRAQSELEKIYAEDPHYEDVAARLGL